MKYILLSLWPTYPLSLPTYLFSTGHEGRIKKESGACSAQGCVLATLAIFFSLVVPLSYVYTCREPNGTHCGCPKAQVGGS